VSAGGPRPGPTLVLASESPRRRQLLEQLGLHCQVHPAHLDETLLPGEDPATHVKRLALEKARAVADRYADAMVIAGDTAVVLDDRILAKPRDPDDAVAMLLRLQGRVHRVDTGVAVAASDGRAVVDVVSAAVTFRPFGEEFARAYVRTGEPLDKAGAYGIQGYGAVLVDRIVGDYYAVVGLPLARVVELLEEMGLEYSFGEAPHGNPATQH
jgi:septum formation protein